MNERRINASDYKNPRSARFAVMALKRWGWIEVGADPLGWTLVKPWQLPPDQKALLDAM